MGTCTSCGQVINPGGHFCLSCGRPVAAAGQPPGGPLPPTATDCFTVPPTGRLPGPGQFPDPDPWAPQAAAGWPPPGTPGPAPWPDTGGTRPEPARRPPPGWVFALIGILGALALLAGGAAGWYLLGRPGADGDGMRLPDGFDAGARVAWSVDSGHDLQPG